MSETNGRAERPPAADVAATPQQPAQEALGTARKELTALRTAQSPVDREVTLHEIGRLVTELTTKHSDPIGSDYDQGVHDHGMRIIGKINALLPPDKQPGRE